MCASRYWSRILHPLCDSARDTRNIHHFVSRFPFCPIQFFGCARETLSRRRNRSKNFSMNSLSVRFASSDSLSAIFDIIARLITRRKFKAQLESLGEKRFSGQRLGDSRYCSIYTSANYGGDFLTYSAAIPFTFGLCKLQFPRGIITRLRAKCEKKNVLLRH